MYKIGIISDIHSNLAALKIALDILQQESVKEIFVCGDIVGYGKSPNECCEVFRDLDCKVVAGNHDWAVAGLTEYKDSFSGKAREGIDLTRDVIENDNLKWLQDLPVYHREGDMEFVHSSLIAPEEWYYLTIGSVYGDSIWQDVRENFEILKGRFCFVGHTHVPAIFLERKPGKIKPIEPNAPYYDLEGHRAIIDVGSVGLPRNRSGKASLVIYDRDMDRIWFKRFKE
ncbi:metallophosphoesterase family protein [Thermodesulfobacteriota bacterium]